MDTSSSPKPTIKCFFVQQLHFKSLKQKINSENRKDLWMGFKCGRKSIKQETIRSNIHLTISINVKPIHGPPNHDFVLVSVAFFYKS